MKNSKTNLRTLLSFLIMVSINLVLLLRRGVYPYEYMDGLEKFNEILLPEKDKFHSNLNMGDNPDADYMHAKEFVNTLK